MWRHMTDWGDKTHFRETTGDVEDGTRTGHTKGIDTKANKKHNLETWASKTSHNSKGRKSPNKLKNHGQMTESN